VRYGAIADVADDACTLLAVLARGLAERTLYAQNADGTSRRAVVAA